MADCLNATMDKCKTKAVILIGMMLMFLSLKGYAQPCLSGWSYRVPVVVDNSGGGSLSNFQVSFTVNTQTLIAQAKMKLDGSDIRIVSATGSVLSHWVEPATFNTSSTKIWVKIPSIAAGSTSIIYLFYGNAGAFSIANGNSTFEFFDDFNVVSVDPSKWTQCNGGDFTFSDGSLTLSSTSSSSDKAILRTSSPFSTLTGPYTAEMYVDAISNSGGYIGVAHSTNSTGYGLYYEDAATNSMRMRRFSSGTSCHDVDDLTPSAGWVDAFSVEGVWRITWAAYGQQRIDWPGAATHPLSLTDNLHGYPANIRLVVGHSEQSGSITVDWVRLRKYAATEPMLTVGTPVSLVNTAVPFSNGPVCEGSELKLFANTVEGATYSWVGPNGFTSSDQNPVIASPTVAATGMYTLTITVPSGCASASTNLSVTVYDETVAGALSGGGAVCEGSNSGTIILAGNVGEPIRWESSPTGLAPWTTITSTDTELDYDNVKSTIYFRAVVKSGVCPVQYTSPEAVEVTPLAVGGNIIGPPPVCSGENSGTLLLVGHVGSITEWQSSTDNWMTFTSIANSTTSYTFSNLEVTTQFRVFIESGSCPSVFSSPYLVTVHPLPEPDFIAPPVCDMQPMVFTNTSSISSGVITSYLWDFGDGSNSIEEEPSHLFLNPGTYDVNLIASSSVGCKAGITKTVVVNELPVANFRASNACLGTVIDFENLSTIGSGSMTFEWNFGDGTTSIIFSPEHLYAEARAYPVKLYATSGAGCKDSIMKTIEVYALPVANAGKDTTISRGFGVMMQASGGENYTWSPITGLSNSDISNPIANPEETTTYTVLVRDEHECEDTDDVTVFVSRDYRLIVSNVLTPDGNGQNDTWNIFNIESFQEESNVEVYNRWGRKVFSQKGYKNDWQGVDGTDILPDGTYYYVIYFENSDIIYKGAISILRNKQ